MKKPLDLQKKQLRKILKEQRNRLNRESCASSDNAIFTNIRTWDIYQKAYTVFCFVGTEDEINTKLIIEDILKRGKRELKYSEPVFLRFFLSAL